MDMKRMWIRARGSLVLMVDGYAYPTCILPDRVVFFMLHRLEGEAAGSSCESTRQDL